MENVSGYVHQTPEYDWRITGSRVSLDSIVYAYWEGLSPEVIATDFPTLSLEQIHGAIAFYLHNKQEIDHYLAAQDARWEQLRQQCEVVHGSLLQRIRA
jgi:uncharacterized protein (DUF433 family)